MAFPHHLDPEWPAYKAAAAEQVAASRKARLMEIAPALDADAVVILARLNMDADRRDAARAKAPAMRRAA